MRNAQTVSTLENEILICNLRDKVVSGCPRTQASLMVRESTALAENQWAFDLIISGDCTNAASVQMAETKRVI